MTMRIEVSQNRRRRQRGSALLIVLVMAAIIGVMLYKEMPISAFEAQRQKEELVVERGGEYKHAIKLFVRKFGRFPGSIAELESTNRMRFLRRKYDDPLTGKNDWRLLHAGMGGVIIDSKIKDNSKKPGDATALGSGATFAGFNNSIVQADPNAEAAGPASAAMRQRPSATTNAGSLNAAGALDFPPIPNTSESPAPGVGNGQGLYPGMPADNANGPGQQGRGAPSQMPNANQAQSAAGLTTLANDPSVLAAMAGVPATTASPGNSAVMQQLNSQNPMTPQGPLSTPAQPGSPGGLQNTGAFPQSSSNASQQNGQGQMGGGIAGVASISLGKSIKTVNDQTKYSLWEFVYDLRKEQAGNAANPLQNPAGNNPLNGGNNANSGFNSGSSTSGFGQQSSPVTPQQNPPSPPPL